jgi:hypothetical protein
MYAFIIIYALSSGFSRSHKTPVRATSIATWAIFVTPDVFRFVPVFALLSRAPLSSSSLVLVIFGYMITNLIV